MGKKIITYQSRSVGWGVVLFLMAIFSIGVHAQITVTLGPEEIVYDWSEDKCEKEDIPDSTARAFIDADGKTQLIATHFINRRFIGTNLDSLEHECGIIMPSSGEANPENFNDKEWIASTYTLDGQTIYALIHNEFQAHAHPGVCDFNDYFKCWYNAITFAQSTDAGKTYTQTSPPTLVASVPYAYDRAAGKPYGLFGPSNIIKKDNYYYSFLHTETYGAQAIGACLMRTLTPNNPSSWEFWGGNGFTHTPVNPYTDSIGNPSSHTCVPILPNVIGKMSESVTYNTYLKKYILVGTHQVWDSLASKTISGFFFSLSNDLIQWSAPQLLMEAKLPWLPIATETGIYKLYPSLLEETDSRNFELTGKEPYLYYTRKNNSVIDPNYDRDLIRRKIIFQDSTPPAPPAPICVDADSDGFGISNTCEGLRDCNDTNPAIFPGANEICNNKKDDNCNTQIDEGCTATSTCTNGIKDGNETGIDCGGSCEACNAENNGQMYLFAGLVLMIGFLLLLIGKSLQPPRRETIVPSMGKIPVPLSA